MAVGQQVRGVNPEILRWARVQSGRSLDEVANRFKKSSEVIHSWETGESAPTYPQLERLAQEIYKRPVALFFFPEPPIEPTPQQFFRTLPDTAVSALQPDTRLAIRQGQSMQISLRELHRGRNDSHGLIFRSFEISLDSTPVEIARGIRNYLGINISIQTSWKDENEAFIFWRAAIQEKGIYVFMRSFKQKDISGFCLLDEEFPIIYINNSTSIARQIFTLLHELTHILLGIGDIATEGNEVYQSSNVEFSIIEKFCNQVASEALLPSEQFDRHLTSFTLTEEALSTLAMSYRVSREVILRRLLDKNLVSQEIYKNSVERYNEDFIKRKESGKTQGGDYYATQAKYLGDKYLDLAFKSYYAGRFDLEQLAEYLQTKPKNIEGLEEVWLAKAAKQ